MRTSPGEHVRFEARPHGVVLVPSFLRAFAAAAVGTVALLLPWPAPVAGPVLIGLGAVVAVAAVWRWDRTRLFVTTEKIVLEHGVVRRRISGVRLSRVRRVEVEQTVPGRLLGYGTLIAGGLEVDYVPRPGELADMLG